MTKVHRIERRRLLIGMGALAAAGWASDARWLGVRRSSDAAPPAVGTRAPASNASSAWKPISPWERTFLGAVPAGAAATVFIRGVWGPMAWPEDSSDSLLRRPDSAKMFVAEPIVHVTRPGDGRPWLRMTWTGRPIELPMSEGEGEVFIVSPFSGSRAPAPDHHPAVHALLSVGREAAIA